MTICFWSNIETYYMQYSRECSLAKSAHLCYKQALIGRLLNGGPTFLYAAVKHNVGFFLAVIRQQMWMALDLRARGLSGDVTPNRKEQNALAGICCLVSCQQVHQVDNMQWNRATSLRIKYWPQYYKWQQQGKLLTSHLESVRNTYQRRV